MVPERQMQFYFLFVILFPAVVKGQTSRQEGSQEPEVNMHRHAGALICILGTWFPLQTGTSLQRAISPGFLFCDTAYNCQGKNGLKFKLPRALLSIHRVNFQHYFQSVACWVRMQMAVCTLELHKSTERESRREVLPVLTEEFQFSLSIPAQYSIYLLLHIFKAHGLLAAADSFILIELDSLLVNTGPSKVK